MTLSEYLHAHDIKPARFAKEIGCPRVLVYRWANEGVTPTVDYLLKIASVTNGAVPVESWAKAEAEASTAEGPAPTKTEAA